MGRGSDVRNVWACVGEVENHGTVAPTLLDSLAEDLCRVEPDNEPSRDPMPGDSHIYDQIRWGETEDIGDDEDVEWGALPHPTPFTHALPAHHVVECDRVAHRADHQGRPQVKRLRFIRHSQRETVAASSPSSRNRFAALDDDTVPRDSEADLSSSHVMGQSAGSNRVVDVVLLGTPRQSSSVTWSMEFPDDEESVAGDSVDPSPELEEISADVALPREAIIRAAIRSMDEVDQRALFAQRAAVMKSVPRILRSHPGML